jgi:hypothetical protein
MTILKSTCLFLLSTAWAICFGQGSISGKILTAVGGAVAAVPNAPVQAKNLDTQATYKATSASDGSYNLSGLPAGKYEIAVEYVSVGFLPFHQSGVQVVGGKTARADIQLVVDLNAVGTEQEILNRLRDKPAPSGPAPRTGDGTPDLSGVWRPNQAKVVVDGLEPLPEAEAVSGQRAKRGRRTDLGPTVCLPGGISLASYFGAYRIVQTPTLIVILDGGFNPDRQIYLDGRGHPKDFNPSWMGHSIGHWEGDTLMVDTAGFNDLGWIQPRDAKGRWPAGFPTTEKLRIIERFRRPDLGHLEVETTYDDPSEFQKPFTTREVRSLAPNDEEILEYVCNENEKDAAHTHFDK